LVVLLSPAALALELPETSASYRIEVRLDPETRTLDGRETIRWVNPSRHPIETVQMHLYLNGFSHDQTTWMRAPAWGSRIEDLLKLHEDPWGWNEPTLIRQGNSDLSWAPIAPDDGNHLDRSLIEVALAEPVAPGKALELEVAFEARLPIPMARTGGYEDYFMVAQWYPKLAVFETEGVRGAVEDGWAGHQFHGPTNFYAEYADYDVRIGVPEGWEVASTGEGGREEMEPADGEGGIWYRFRQRAVHDFAFAAGERMVDVVSTHRPAGSGPSVEIHLFLPEGTEPQAERWRRVIEGSLDVLGSRIGPYPYSTITAVLPPPRGRRTTGMEYPTLFTALPGDPYWDTRPFSSVRLNEAVIAHEFAHEYFYGIVGTNEFEEAFLDEGFTQYWGNEAMIGTYGDEGGAGSFLGRTVSVSGVQRAVLPDAGTVLPPVWTEPSYLARGYSIGAQFYHRPATTLATAAGLLGQETVDRVFALYYERWAFRHPRFEDFLDAAREAGGEDFAEFILEAFTRERLPDYRVASFETTAWSSPQGRIVTESGIFGPDDDKGADGTLHALDPAARERDGSLLM
jgi:hypothetical protein